MPKPTQQIQGRAAPWALLCATLAALPMGCGRHPAPPAASRVRAQPRTVAEKIVAGARAQVEQGVGYDARYVRIAYPGGDVPPDRGACTDVVVRALRAAGFDLQVLVHKDMQRHFVCYPRYGLAHPDPNIDHRRVPNQIVFFRRHAQALPISLAGWAAATWQPGDLVYWKLPGGHDHCGVLSDTRGAQGLPLVIHNAGRAAEEDCLAAWPIAAHFRFPPRPTPLRSLPSHA